MCRFEKALKICRLCVLIWAHHEAVIKHIETLKVREKKSPRFPVFYCTTKAIRREMKSALLNFDCCLQLIFHRITINCSSTSLYVSSFFSFLSRILIEETIISLLSIEKRRRCRAQEIKSPRRHELILEINLSYSLRLTSREREREKNLIWDNWWLPKPSTQCLSLRTRQKSFLRISKELNKNHNVPKPLIKPLVPNKRFTNKRTASRLRS